MNIRILASTAAAALLLAGCGQKEVDPATTANVATSATSDLSAVASNTPDAATANAIVNDAGEILNTVESNTQ